VRPLGVHFLLDVAGAPFATLDDAVLVERVLVDAVVAMGANVLGIHIHRLSPQGVSGVVVISESHLTIHTWPERGEAAVDLFTCGDIARARAAVDALAQALGAATFVVEERVRGVGAR
jgi:S-adenosylmethionine decarboxylase